MLDSDAPRSNSITRDDAMPITPSPARARRLRVALALTALPLAIASVASLVAFGVAGPGCSNATFTAVDEAGAGGDGSTTGDDGGGTIVTPPDAGPVIRRGQVVAEVLQSNTASPTFDVVASFDSVPGLCASTASGLCTIERCKPDTDASANAGTISVAGGAAAYVLTPDAAAPGGYVKATGAVPPWSGGASLIFSADGGTVPGFHTLVTAPALRRVSSPPFDTMTTSDVTFAKGAELPVAWSAGNGETLLFEGRTTTTAQETTVVRCRIPASGATIPASVMAELGTTGSYRLVTVGEATVKAGDWTVTTSAFWTSANINNVAAAGNYTIK